ncbi:hypothetical protein BKP35_17105 [Anaerobacillus arseniciselenatis]|uniref:histidine kinase n=1 Tax=Anaerobacillus arseniciselenatis TaxID=85682 RepID=A0A1S2LCI8_9BACI|nr:PAS domain-containing sensor histidine kinase [Anaerobacillus arseniciselenatis]OIJ09255.1 hypothetical protein BKP35_17105 [Anaerobacillus arseniciselenatis]
METNLFNAMFQQSAIAMAIVKINGTFIYVNNALCELTGYRKEELIDETNQIFSHPEDLKIQRENTRRLIKGEIPFYQMEKRYIHKEGHIVWGLISINLISDDYEIPKYVICQVQNITEKKEMERRLLESEERYRRLVESSPETIAVLVDEKIEYLNPAGMKLLGAKSKEEIIGRSIWDFYPKEDHERVHQNMLKILSGSTQSMVAREHTIFRFDGTPVSISSTISATTYKGVQAIQAIVRDITEMKKVDEWLQKSEKLSLVGQLAAGVAHEVRNPLTSIKGFIQLAKTTKEFKEFYVDIILSELDRTETIIYEFLSLAKPNDTRQIKTVNFNTILLNVIKLLETQALMQDINIQYYFLKDVVVDCDENQIKQAFINLIQNAIEASDRNENIFITLDEVNENEIIVKIEDHGCGISKERLKKLGEPFYSTKEKGTGLGLLVTYKIIEGHHGKLTFLSDEGMGTTAEIILPKKIGRTD